MIVFFNGIRIGKMIYQLFGFRNHPQYDGAKEWDESMMNPT
jgi:hypothetical protein